MAKDERVVLKDITLEELARFFDHLTAEKKYVYNPLHYRLIFVAGIKQNNEIVAIGGLKRHLGIFPFSFRIVKTEFQRKGLSQQLFNENLKFAREKSFSYILGTIHKGNIPALNASLKTGFKTICESDTYYQMCLPLNKRGEVIARFLPLAFSIYYVFRVILRKRNAGLARSTI
jgi:GNAT superfamily N-acetyltransferase